MEKEEDGWMAMATEEVGAFVDVNRAALVSVESACMLRREG